MIPGVVVTADGGLTFDPELAGGRDVMGPNMMRSVDESSPAADELARRDKWWQRWYGVWN